MNNIQETLLFPVRDADARRQFLFACLVMLASFAIPLLPLFVLMGYNVKIMRQIIEERKNPPMPAWQGIDWAETFLDGIKLYGVQFILMLPVFLLMGCGFVFLFGGMLSMATLMDESTRAFAPVSGAFFFIGIAFLMLFSLVSLPYGVIISAASPHMAAKHSFAAGFEVREWWAIFRMGWTQFLLAYLINLAVSFVFVFIMQVAMATIVLMCVVPFVMIPYSVYLSLVMHAFYAQAYLAGRDAIQAG